MKLGRLEPEDLRKVWGNEAQDFTPWLARPENLNELGKTIGMELELTAQEESVGLYRADVLCKDTLSQSYVLIENQLDKTDHSHLGQTLTYAAGLAARSIVWIAAKFTDEHRATLDWLNQITEEDYRFFGLEIELWKIGDSLPAPKFNIVCRPNDWSRAVIDTVQELSETKQLQLKYWSAFRDFVQQKGSPLKPQKPLPQHWMNFSIGRSGFWLASTVNTLEGRLGVELFLSPKDPKTAFRALLNEKEAIEAALGGPALDWQELPEAKGSRIALYKSGVDIRDEQDWPIQHKWLAETLECFNGVFRPKVRELKLP